jgi:hypothetical protein
MRIRRRRARQIARLATAAAVLLFVAFAGWRLWMADRPQSPKTPLAQSESPLPAALSPTPPEIGAAARDEERAAARVEIDVGPAAIAVSQPSSDSTIHIFWIYPTVNVSLHAADGPADPTELERNPS